MKVGIVGCGLVGSTAAYAMIMRGVGREIVLVDVNPLRVNAEVDDLFHAVPFAHPLTVRSGQFEDLAGSQVVIIAAGVNQRPGENRMELMARNAAIFRLIVPIIVKSAPDAVLVVATNPVDVMTHLAGRIAQAEGIPKGRVIGSGTTLDTARFRTVLGRHLEVDPQHVHGYVVGEHGDSEVLVWSGVSVGGVPLNTFLDRRSLSLTDEQRRGVDEKVRRAAYTIIQGKGATYYGIGSALAKIAEAILCDRRAILTVCAEEHEIAGTHQVTVSLPRIVGGRGSIATVPIDLDVEEREAFHRSLSILADAQAMVV